MAEDIERLHNCINDAFRAYQEYLINEAKKSVALIAKKYPKRHVYFISAMGTWFVSIEHKSPTHYNLGHIQAGDKDSIAVELCDLYQQALDAYDFYAIPAPIKIESDRVDGSIKLITDW